MDVLNKATNYALLQSGNLGNRLRSWDTLKEWEQSGFGGLVALRMRAGYGGGTCIYSIPPQSVHKEFDKFIALGVEPGAIMINEMAPNTMVLQGEYYNDVVILNNKCYWDYFFYSTAKLHMRDALKCSPQETYGLSARIMLQQHMSASSWGDWQVLITNYPKHVLEVSIYENFLGDTPGRNTLVWEVRKY
jgi:hypothetical protein